MLFYLFGGCQSLSHESQVYNLAKNVRRLIHVVQVSRGRRTAALEKCLCGVLRGNPCTWLGSQIVLKMGSF